MISRWSPSVTDGNQFEYSGPLPLILLSLQLHRYDTCSHGRVEAGPLAQLVEQRTFNPWVVGSIPTGPTQSGF